MCVIVRQEQYADRPFVNDLIKAAFEKVRESDHREHFLVERLRQSDAFIPQLSLVAETCDKRIIGYTHGTWRYTLLERRSGCRSPRISEPRYRRNAD